jgi:o-succinylbenzoate---CoA ligase
MQRYKVTAFIAVPTMIDDIISAAKQRWVTKLPRIEKVLVGAGGLKPHQFKGLYSLAPRAVVHTAYGMTEATSSLTFDTTPSSMKKSGTTTHSNKGDSILLLNNVPIPGAVYVGRPPPGIELAVLCGEEEEEGGEGSLSVVKLHSAVGELVTRGPHVMLGYWQPSTTTTTNSCTIYVDGWFKTGDLGAIDTRGGIWLTGRVSDVIRTGGEGVSAWEVETCIASHPGIESVAVVGVPDDRLGELVAAGVVLKKGWKWHGGLRCQDLRNDNSNKDGSSSYSSARSGRLPLGVVDGMAVQNYCRKTCQLSGYKLPRVVMVFGGGGKGKSSSENDMAMPRTTSTGKVLKTEVKQRIVDALMDYSDGTKDVTRSRL